MCFLEVVLNGDYCVGLFVIKRTFCNHRKHYITTAFTTKHSSSVEITDLTVNTTNAAESHKP